MNKKKYEILRVPPNEKSFNHAYTYIKAYLGDNMKMSEQEFWIDAISCYFASKEYSQYTGVAYIKDTVENNMTYHDLQVVIFDSTAEDLYTMCYDLIRTITKDQNDTIIRIYNVPEEADALKKALRNLKFKPCTDSTQWRRFPLSDTPERKENHYCFNKGRFKEFDYRSDVDTVDKMVSFHNNNTETIAQDRYVKELLEKNRNEKTYSKTCQQTEEDFMRPNPPCNGCCYSC